jgi:Sperm-tail PG-rich repeat
MVIFPKTKKPLDVFNLPDSLSSVTMYQENTSTMERRGAALSLEPRWRTMNRETPGPGHYRTPLQLSHSAILGCQTFTTAARGKKVYSHETEKELLCMAGPGPTQYSPDRKWVSKSSDSRQSFTRALRDIRVTQQPGPGDYNPSESKAP